MEINIYVLKQDEWYEVIDRVGGEFERKVGFYRGRGSVLGKGDVGVIIFMFCRWKSFEVIVYFNQ